LRLEDLVEVQEEGGKNSECTNQNTQVCQALLSKAEPINVDEDDDERFEPDMKQTVYQGDIKIESEHDPRFLDGQYASNRQRATINLPSVKFRVNGLTRDMIAISLVDMPSPMSSASHRRFWLPVSFLSLLVRRTSKLFPLVSGRQNIRTTQQNPLSQTSSQIGHVQSSCWAANPPTSGPRTGPQIADIPLLSY